MDSNLNTQKLQSPRGEGQKVIQSRARHKENLENALLSIGCLSEHLLGR